MPAYVVLEWNQASGRPRLATDDLFDEVTEAQKVAGEATQDARSRGRRESYTVHEVDMDDVEN